MARPKKRNQAEVKSKILTLKLTKEDHDRLKKLVAARATELREVTGQRFELSASAYVRWLMDRDAAARGLDTPSLTKGESPPNDSG